MNKEITFEKINLPFVADPNIANPTTTEFDTDVLLTFESKENFDSNEEKTSKMNFNNTLMYRVGSPNDEGFNLFGTPGINNSSIYSKNNFPDLEFGYFYKVSGVDWKNQLLGAGTKILNDKYKDFENFSHFIFFMKDGTFECIAENYKIEEI